jgi:predicted kinase
MSVVMDFQANTVARRNSLAALAWESDAQVTLHVLETSDAQCLDRLKARNAAGNHPFQVSEAQFHALAQYYEHPTTDEGLPIATYRS